ncbi:dihydrodipicolinate synthase family protein [Variovorax sp. J31P207]|uniref:dihydrodipicolinate synthase family protein n=1 Tax=Variovorax sp. J31P207 TaxID=3053510 RepID=UPI0025790178|nr:dihydrodipicolinate synthase family protein [Variovorax sp. J31P207]MDM0065129.1 dihydrodipicolinate synthase family protein [Variovorax sp. J31P207]
MTESTASLRTALDGISGILVTPFDDTDRIAPDRLAPVIDRAIAAGVHVLVANGNTSEFFGLTMAEAEHMVHAAAEHVAGRVPLLGGVGRSVHDACALARASRQAGAAALMVHQLTDPFVAPSGVVTYVRRIADAADGLPVVLYLRDDAIGLPVIEALCRIPQVIGVKWASPTPLRLVQAMAQVADRGLAWVCGLAEPWAPPMYAVGARGFTSGLINLRPELSMRIHAALAKGDYTLATELIGGIATFEELRTHERNGANVSVVKAALRYAGLDCGAARPPSTWPLPEADRLQLERLVDGWK